jgi:hypothetical protein
MTNSYSIHRRSWKWTKKLFFHFLDMTILSSFLLLTSCSAKMTHRDFQLALVQNLIEDAGSLPRPHRPLGRPAGPDKKVSQFEVNFSNHWPVHSSRVNCRTCSARGIRKRVQIKCKECEVGLCTGVSKRTTKNSSCDVLKSAGTLRNHKTSHQTAMYKQVARIVQ